MARTIPGRVAATVGAIVLLAGHLAVAAAQQCAGDCDQNGSVDASDLVLGVQIATAQAPLAACPTLDENANGVVSIDEVTAAIRAAIDGCGAAGRPGPRAIGTVTLVIGTAIVSAGDTGSFDVSMDSGGFEVAGIQIDITYDPLTPIAGSATPDCVINPATGKSLFRAFVSSTTARFLVLSLSDVDPIPDGVLFTCNVDVSPSAPPAVYPLTGSNEGASDPDGMALTTISTPGAVIVILAPPTPTSTPTAIGTPTQTPIPPGACPPTPGNGCHTAGKGRLTLGNGKLAWKWLNGTTNLTELGYPVAGPTSYTLCVYGSQAGSSYLAMRANVPGGTMCGGTFCWRPNGLRGFRYKDPAGSADGITKIRLKTGTGDASVLIKGEGAQLPIPPPADPNNLVYQDPNVIVQLRNSNGACWEATYPGPAQRMSGTQIVDRF